MANDRYTVLLGKQIHADVCGDGLIKDTDRNFKVDLKTSGGLKIDTAQLAVEPADFAGDGLADDGSDNLKLDLNELTAAVVDVANDSIAIVDANDADTSRKEAIADVMTAVAGVGLVAASGVLAVDLDEVAEVAVDVANDSIAILDNSDSGDTKKDTIADLVTAMAGAGLTATNGVLSADALTDNVVESDFVTEDQSANCDGGTAVFTLANTPLAGSLHVYLNTGFLVGGSGADYTLSGNQVTIGGDNPVAGEILVFVYVKDN